MAGTLRLNNTGTGNGQSTITTAASGDTTYTLPSGGGTFVTTSSTQALTVPFASGTVSAPSITFLGDSNTGLYSPAADTIAFTEGGTESFRCDSLGRLLVGTTTATANGGVIQTSNGITFPATQSACSDANTLDDYEEGTWTPSLGGNTTYNTQTGKYTKIGNMVYVSLNIWVNSIGTGSTTQITGLPFALSGISGLAIQYLENSSTNIVYLVARASGGTTITLGSLTAAGATTGANAIFKNSTDIQVGGCYAVS